ncbi:DNA-binding MarR family transcriptional regulator [Deinococcus humi]|uniref:DNA-binding MarR family transcriptional regulator n=1 Tax=Deinococcus humi TaxID=662880 RepID=A0A7W8NEU1_9DEIO|nr:DNA-binding MarR family transcriptional regulator [Deinococcus humi]GGO29752.1 hypothetical protein GCM10008949_23680 [Deinococcus humi]
MFAPGLQNPRANTRPAPCGQALRWTDHIPPEPSYLTFTTLKVMAALTLPSPNAQGHYGGSLSRMSQVGHGQVLTLLSWLRARGWATDTGTEPGPGKGRRKDVRLTDDGRRYFERHRERRFPPSRAATQPHPRRPSGAQPCDWAWRRASAITDWA